MDDEIMALIAKSRVNAKKAMICSGIAVLFALTAVIIQIVVRFT